MVSAGWPQDLLNEDWEHRGNNVGHDNTPRRGERSLSTFRQAMNHQRMMIEGIQRPPLGQARQRSNTSVESNTHTGRPSLSVENETKSDHRRSTSMSIHSRTDSSGSFTRTLKSKASRLLRRQGSHGDLTSLKTIDWSEELDESPWEKPSAPSHSPKRQARRFQRKSQLQISPTRHDISLPFDFRHLTHTNDDDFREMQDVPAHELQAGFATLRASDVPKGELRGIKAEKISRRDTYTTPRPAFHGYTKPSPHIPARPENPWGAAQLLGTQVSTGSPALPNSPRPPPQWQPPPTVPEVASPTHSASYNPNVYQDNSNLADFVTPHAVTTPDDAAQALRPPPFEMVRTELSRVIEEDEMSERRSSMATLTRKLSNADSSIRHVKSFPSSTRKMEHCRKSSAESYRQSVQASPKKQRRSVKVLQPPFDDVDGDVPFQRLSRRYSATVKDVDGNWDDVIDWCYDHEAEADCNFDFARAVSPMPQGPTPDSFDDSATLLHSTAFALEKSERRSSSVYSGSPPLLPQLHTSPIPDLEQPSAISAQSSFDSASEALTPDTATPNLDLRFPLFNTKPHYSKPHLHHLPHVSNDMTPPDLYETLCQEAYARDPWHYGRAEGSTISSVSERSSRGPISKSSSQESFNLRPRRSNNTSQGSLPELIPSRFSRDKNDHLSDTTDHLTNLTVDDSRRKSPTSLVKDVAQKNLISKLQNGAIIDDACNAELPLPMHPALRNNGSTLGNNNIGTGGFDRYGIDRSTTDLERKRSTLAPSSLSREDGPTPLRPATGQRMRSASSAANLKGSAAGAGGGAMKTVNISPRASRASYGLYPMKVRG